MLKFIFRLIIILSLLKTTTSTSMFSPDEKFKAWFLEYAPHFRNVSITTCNSTLEKYRHPGIGEEPPRLTSSRHAACILDNTDEIIKANMASAGVVLGLMPSLISLLGPTLAESSILMIERPLLSSLLVIGGPALYSFRPFDQGSSESLHKSLRSLPYVTSGFWARFLISLFQYIVAVAAAINVIFASVELGLKTILTWKKDASYFPLIWVFLSLCLHLCAAVKYRWFIRKV